MLDGNSSEPAKSSDTMPISGVSADVVGEDDSGFGLGASVFKKRGLNSFTSGFKLDLIDVGLFSDTLSDSSFSSSFSLDSSLSWLCTLDWSALTANVCSFNSPWKQRSNCVIAG